MSIQNDKRVYLYDNLKCFLIFCVVIGHFAERIVEFHIMKTIYIYVYMFHMPLFVFITGLFAKNTLKSINKVVNRSIEFLLLNVALKIIIFISNPGIKISFLWEGTAAWYLAALVLYYPISYYLQKVDWKLVLSISCLCGLLIGITDFEYTLNLSRIFVMFPFFYLGVILKRENIEKLTKYKYLRCLSILCVVLVFLICYFNTDTIYAYKDLFRGCISYANIGLNAIEGILARMICYIVSLLVGISLIIICPIKKIKAISWIGTKTLQVYFWHCPIIYGGLRYGLFDKIATLLNNNLPRTIWEICYLLIACIVVVVLLHPVFGIILEYFMKPMKFVKRIYIGEEE